MPVRKRDLKALVKEGRRRKKEEKGKSESAGCLTVGGIVRKWPFTR